jgi:hypothetical protein
MTKDNRREQIIDLLRKEFIGADPIDMPEMTQKDGEEILSSDPPRVRYAAGVLFPQKSNTDFLDLSQDEIVGVSTKPNDDELSHIENAPEVKGAELDDSNGEELLNLSNAYQQSAMSMTVAIKNGSVIKVNVRLGNYKKLSSTNSKTNKKQDRHYRNSIEWNNADVHIQLPDQKQKIIRYEVEIDGIQVGLRFNITLRYVLEKEACSIYTFTLENAKKSKDGKIRDEDCFFQSSFELLCENGFSPLPKARKINLNDDDYLSNTLLYRKEENFAVGHGCSSDWITKDSKVVRIFTEIFPTYEVKPILPNNISGVSLDMFQMSDLAKTDNYIEDLKLLALKYLEWINEIELEAKLLAIEYKPTALRHIKDCKECHKRMCEGIHMIEDEKIVKRSFELMNRAMLLQQLHFNLPLQKWNDNGRNGLELNEEYSVMPDIEDSDTWYGNFIYGKWRPFQIAFILLNITSMYDKESADRGIVDLIWFPTGGGKTEAYLGLSAFTIFLRRLRKKGDAGTAILMRYTLRLLTTQQFERAASMICACESIRNEISPELGHDRITIGLWVGGETTPNKMADAIKDYNMLYNGKSNKNPFVMLKCPWCGAQMGKVDKKFSGNSVIGYKKIKDSNRSKIIFLCENDSCMFSHLDNTLPLTVIDEEVYENPPTLLLGTVDKFAMLTYRPEAQSIFGINCDNSPPELIIQDELHLISGPLGSMVGHYETLISELCTANHEEYTIVPKIITSTATISRAKEQCNALYNCGIKKVKQFPPSGLDAGESFFAYKDNAKIGRKYVGVFAPSASSFAMTIIRLYSSLLYAAKEIEVDDELKRDPYWTNLGYFNSLRELGQTATWISADIDEYLHTIYKRRYEDKKTDYKEKRRYIYRFEELTSRIDSSRISASLQNLSEKYKPNRSENKALDICLATNMVSVGVDVSRLGLMTVTGQPKTTAEYIQATSRVGRSEGAPGLVFIVYNPGRPRDKSHYEQFRSYHSKIYSFVEPTSVTPFAGPVRDKALHAVLIGLIRLRQNKNAYNDPSAQINEEEQARLTNMIINRVCMINPEEVDNTVKALSKVLKIWKNTQPQIYQDFRKGEETPLMYPLGTTPNLNWDGRGFPTPTSMRNVDSTCEVEIINHYTTEEE